MFPKKNDFQAFRILDNQKSNKIIIRQAMSSLLQEQKKDNKDKAIARFKCGNAENQNKNEKKNLS